MVELAVPADWLGSKPEYYAWWALRKLGIEFSYQYPRFGGRLLLGGTVIDFFLPNYNLAINIQSDYWHYRDAEMRASDAMQRVQVESSGTRVIYIQEADILENPIFYIQEATKGQEHYPAWA